jgi:hypothetical protein
MHVNADINDQFTLDLYEYRPQNPVRNAAYVECVLRDDPKRIVSISEAALTQQGNFKLSIIIMAGGSRDACPRKSKATDDGIWPHESSDM